MADPGFPRWGKSLKGGVNLLFDKIIAENCMKIKEIGLIGRAHVPSAARPGPPLRIMVTLEPYFSATSTDDS